MPGTTSYYAVKTSSKRNRIAIILLLLLSIVVIFYFARTSIMRVVVKNPAAFHVAMKGKALLGKVGLPVSADYAKTAEAITLPDRVEIAVDLGQSIGRFTQFWGGIGYNSFKAGSLNPDNQKLFQLMREANEKNPGTFNYIRVFNIFTNGEAVTQYGEGCEIYSEDEMGKPQFDWTTCDRVFDVIVSMGFDVIVDFTLMPMELASNKKRIQPWYGGNMSPPLSHKKWANLVYETVRHLTQRYGLERVMDWYFEVWNEPDLAWLFWIPDADNSNPRLREWGDMDAYNKLYDYTVAAVKQVNPGLQVGGPAVAGSYIEPFLEHLNKKNYRTGKKGTQVDFLSFHSYGSVFEKVISKIDEIHRTAGKIEKKYQQLPYIVSEFSPSPYDPPWYVSRYPALWFIATVDAIFNYADQNGRAEFLPRSMIYWTAPVVKDFGQHHIEKKTDGLATTLGTGLLKLPVFNAFEMLGYLSDERVPIQNSVPFPDYRKNLGNEFIHLLNAIATRSDSSFEVLVYQFTENDAFSKNQKEYQVSLAINNFPDQKYYLKKYKIGVSESNVYTSWMRMKSPLNPGKNQLTILEQGDDLKLLMPAHQPDIAGKKYSEEMKLATNEAVLLVFKVPADFTPPLNLPGKLTKNVGTNSVYLQWNAPGTARDGDAVAGYEVYQNDQLVALTFQNHFSSENLKDNTRYRYEVYSLDDQGNRCEQPLRTTVQTELDNTPPRLVELKIVSGNELELKFSEPIDASLASSSENYTLSGGMAIKSVSLSQDGKRVSLNTTPHQKGEKYALSIHTVRDRARMPNAIENYEYEYVFSLKFEDRFDFDNLNSYLWKHIWEEGGIGRHSYDAAGKRLKVTTGDDIGESFARALPELDRGIFKIDFHPLKNYPTGGRFILKLKQDEHTYYQVEKTHGYGPGYVKKVIRGMTVDSTACSNEFQHGKYYQTTLKFSPGLVSFSGFSETTKIDNNNYPIQVNQFEVQLLQQDAYFDNIYFESR